MGLPKERIVFGVHSITPVRRSDAKPYGILKVLGGGNLELTGETEDLYGGSSKYPYASEPTNISTQLTANVKSYPNFLMELFLGASVTSQTASATGEVRDFVNYKGASVKAASTGIASVGLKSGANADLKFGRYVIEATAADEVDVYAITDIDFNRGTDKVYIDGSLKIAEGLEIAQDAATEVPGFGIELTGGSGTIGMTPGDTAVFDVFPAHEGISYIDVGSSTSEFPAFGAFMLAQKNGQNDIFQIEAFNCQGSGMPMPLAEKAFMISDLTIKLLRDESKNAVFRLTHITEV